MIYFIPAKVLRFPDFFLLLQNQTVILESCFSDDDSGGCGIQARLMSSRKKRKEKTEQLFARLIFFQDIFQFHHLLVAKTPSDFLNIFNFFWLTHTRKRRMNEWKKRRVIKPNQRRKGMTHAFVLFRKKLLSAVICFPRNSFSAKKNEEANEKRAFSDHLFREWNAFIFLQKILPRSCGKRMLYFKILKFRLDRGNPSATPPP